MAQTASIENEVATTADAADIKKISYSKFCVNNSECFDEIQRNM